MSSTSETGHAKNLSAFQSLISFCKGYGPAYNPGRMALTTKAMETQLAAAQAALANVKTAEMSFGNATNQRVLAFKALKPLATQLVNALAAAGASTEAVKDAKTINRKLQGQRAPGSPKPVQPGSTQPEVNTTSASQQSFVQQAEHFNKFIELLSVESAYAPNEAGLQVPALLTTLAGLRAANAAVTDAYTGWSNSRLQRDQLLYEPTTGVVSTALDAKKYIKSVFGAGSPQYNQVGNLRFHMVVS